MVRKHKTKRPKKLNVLNNLQSTKKPFECDQCFYKSANSHNLLRHKRIHSNEKQDFHVAAFISRPVLQVREKGVEQKPMMFTFIDAVARYGRGMVEGDFEEAYRRAGRAFQGQLQQNFVVRVEKGRGTDMAIRDDSSSTPRKRQREEERKTEFQRRGPRGGRGAKRW